MAGSTMVWWSLTVVQSRRPLIGLDAPPPTLWGPYDAPPPTLWGKDDTIVPLDLEAMNISEKVSGDVGPVTFEMLLQACLK